MLDLVGIGSLNIDYIATTEMLSTLSETRRSKGEAKFSHGKEKKEKMDVIDNLFATTWPKDKLDKNLGGSAFNTIRAIKALMPSLNLGFVGIIGETGEPEVSFTKWFEDNIDIDTTCVESMPGKRSGVCISLMKNGERSLLTNDGDIKLSEHLKNYSKKIIKLVSSYRIVHVVSFYDDEQVAEKLAGILGKAKGLNKHLHISFDPGSEWAADISSGVKKIIKLTDILFVNEDEFLALGNFPKKGTSPLSIANDIYDRFGNEMMIIVIKKYAVVYTIRRVSNQTIITPHRYKTLKDNVIVDATGAGDVFAAGVLAARLIPNLEITDGVDLGIRMAREKLKVVGDESFSKFPGVFKSKFDQLAEKSFLEVEAEPIIFIGHGRSPVWRELKDFIESRLGLTVDEFDRIPTVGETITGRLEQMLNKASFAFLIMTAEDEQKDGGFHPRLNVVYEFGLFQGRLGLDKAIILREKNCRSFSNAHGFIEIRFEEGKLLDKSEKIRIALEKAGL